LFIKQDLEKTGQNTRDQIATGKQDTWNIPH